MAKPDFVYEQKDVQMVKAAETALRNAEKKAFKHGFATSLLSLPYSMTRKEPSFTKIFALAIIVGSIPYTMLTSETRAGYRKTITAVNKNVSEQINKAMQF